MVLTKEQAEKVMAALQHAAMSTHHPHCGIWRTNHCDCHVAKAAEALAVMRALDLP